ncbi:MAG: hypothetical protein KF729_18165 [Sandaracinaceae bacterium]|nr:hypothetical protein [Sandaracinaceae bacterium]
MSRRENIGLLVAERDSAWSEWVEPLRGEVHDIAIVLQRMGETPAELATRVRARAAELAGRGELVAAALVGGERWDPDTLNARSLMIRAILSHMKAGTAGARPEGATAPTLYLDAGDKAGRSRHAMQALASVVADQIGGSVQVLTTHGPSAVPVRRAA